MKESYTWTCPKGHPPVSYAPERGEMVRCQFRPPTGKRDKDGDMIYGPPCGEECSPIR